MFTMHTSDAAADGSVSALDSHTNEHTLSLGMGDIQVVQYKWDRPTSDVWISDTYFLHMSLTPRPEPAQAAYVDSDRRMFRNIGRVMFAAPGRTVQTVGRNGRKKSLLCSLQPKLFENVLGREPNWDDATLGEGLALNRPEVDHALLRIYDELRNPGFAQEFMVESLLNALAITLVRTLRIHREEPATSIGGLAPWRIRRIRERVFSDQPAPQLGELAQLCNMSVRHLTRAFKAEADMTIASFVEHAMVERARRMLANSDCSISEIAECLGFASQSSFTCAFRRATGTRPAEFRRQFYPATIARSSKATIRA